MFEIQNSSHINFFQLSQWYVKDLTHHFPNIQNQSQLFVFLFANEQFFFKLSIAVLSANIKFLFKVSKFMFYLLMTSFFLKVFNFLHYMPIKSFFQK